NPPGGACPKPHLRPSSTARRASATSIHHLPQVAWATPCIPHITINRVLTSACSCWPFRGLRLLIARFPAGDGRKGGDRPHFWNFVHDVLHFLLQAEPAKPCRAQCSSHSRIRDGLRPGGGLVPG